MSFFSTLFSGYFWALLGAAIAVGLSGSGSAKGIGIAAEAGTGIVSVSPEKFGRVLLLMAMPGTQGIYGLIVTFMIINSAPFLEGTLTLGQGVAYFCGSLPIAIGGYISAIAQGRVCAASMGIVAAKPEESMKGVISAGMVETYAVIAVLVSIIMVNAIPGLPL